jgi:hypothetical protein
VHGEGPETAEVIPNDTRAGETGEATRVAPKRPTVCDGATEDDGGGAEGVDAFEVSECTESSGGGHAGRGHKGRDG